MTTSDMIRELWDRMNISLAELCRRIGQTPQNFNKKLQRGTVSSEEMAKIAEAIDLVLKNPESEEEIQKAKNIALELCRQFPLPY